MKVLAELSAFVLIAESMFGSRNRRANLVSVKACGTMSAVQFIHEQLRKTLLSGSLVGIAEILRIERRDSSDIQCMLFGAD